MKLVSRRSFLKLAGFTALAVAGASALTACGGSTQVLYPLQFSADAIGEDWAKALDEANIVAAASADPIAQNDLVLAAIKAKMATTSSLGRFPLDNFVILDVVPVSDTLDGTERTCLRVTFTMAQP